MHELFAALRRHAGSNPNAVAFADARENVTYGDLAGRVAGFAKEVRPLPPVLGLLGENGIDWAVAQLAAWLAGKTVVPLPLFFAPEQLAYVLGDAGVSHIVCTQAGAATASRLNVPFTPATQRCAEQPLEPHAGAGQIVYTSGSTGRPKGVRHTSGQLSWSAAALAQACGAGPDDRHLSVMPLPLLLETITAIMVPILAGARVRFEGRIAGTFGAGEASGLAEIFERDAPTSTVLVPQLLASWTDELAATKRRAPHGLRFVAVGGARVSPALAALAWDMGIPVYEGYGLTECASVVALNRPDQRKPGTVGVPLPGLRVSIEDREIVVSGPSVMDGYVNGARARGVWRTGDLGKLDRDGFLYVQGRRDNLLVTALGRNVSPEWIESLLLGDRRIGQCLVAGSGRPRLCALIVPSPAGEKWFARAAPRDIQALLARCCRDAPAYAVPRSHLVVAAAELTRSGLMTSNGRLRRAAVLDRYGAALDGLEAPASRHSQLEATS